MVFRKYKVVRDGLATVRASGGIQLSIFRAGQQALDSPVQALVFDPSQASAKARATR